jgi:hypothetical protein
MKSATGFLVGRRLSLHLVTCVWSAHDRRQPRVVCEAGMTGLGCLAAVAGLVLCLAAAAPAAPIETNPEPLHRDPGWVVERPAVPLPACLMTLSAAMPTAGAAGFRMTSGR